MRNVIKGYPMSGANCAAVEAGSSQPTETRSQLNLPLSKLNVPANIDDRGDVMAVIFPGVDARWQRFGWRGEGGSWLPSEPVDGKRELRWSPDDN